MERTKVSIFRWRLWSEGHGYVSVPVILGYGEICGSVFSDDNASIGGIRDVVIVVDVGNRGIPLRVILRKRVFNEVHVFVIEPYAD